MLNHSSFIDINCDYRCCDPRYCSNRGCYLLCSLEDVKEEKSRAKEIKEYKIKKMHIDGIKEVDVVDGYKIELEKYDNLDDSGSSDYSYDEVKNI